MRSAIVSAAERPSEKCNPGLGLNVITIRLPQKQSLRWLLRYCLAKRMWEKHRLWRTTELPNCLLQASSP